MNYKITMLKHFIRCPYAWPGGYPLVGILADGEAICADCCRKNFRSIVSAIKSKNSHWELSALSINWESNDLYCCNCHKNLESAYGEAI